MRTLDHMSRALRRFLRDESATVTQEFIVLLPLLYIAFCGSYTFFDVYRAKNLSLKANYAVSDLISRETAAITPAYVSGMERMVEYLTQAPGDPWLRVTVLRCSSQCGNEDDRVLRVDWSYGTDDQIALTDEVLQDNYAGIVPVMSLGERVIMVESKVDYVPPFRATFGLLDRRVFRDLVITKPRFAPQLAWAG